MLVLNSLTARIASAEPSIHLLMMHRWTSEALSSVNLFEMLLTVPRVFNKLSTTMMGASRIVAAAAALTTTSRPLSNASACRRTQKFTCSIHQRRALAVRDTTDPGRPNLALAGFTIKPMRYQMGVALSAMCSIQMTLGLNRKRPGRIRRCERLVSGRAGSD